MTETKDTEQGQDGDSSKYTKIELPRLMQLVNSNDRAAVERLLLTGEATVHDLDETGMTALMHASYKGATDMCSLLLQQGSDVNADTHNCQYSPLHFAALSGSVDTVQLLLDHGAKTYRTNSIGRTPAQMAGFVGHARIVALINNQIDRSELRRFTEPSATHQTTTLAREAEEPLYNLMIQVNLNPVHLTLLVGRSLAMLQHTKNAYIVLNRLSLNEMNRSSNVNEVLCLKLHYLSYLVEYLHKEKEKYFLKCTEDTSLLDKSNSGYPKCFESFLKQLLMCRSSDGAEVWQENWLRDAILAFHNSEMPLFMEVARCMKGPDVVALSVLSGAINGQRGGVDSEKDELACRACGEINEKNKSCSRCKNVRYCDIYCQKLHWSAHKKICEKISHELNMETNNEELQDKTTKAEKTIT